MKYSLYHEQAGGWVSCVLPEESEVEEDEEVWEVDTCIFTFTFLLLYSLFLFSTSFYSCLREVGKWSPAWKKHVTALPRGGLRWVDSGNNFVKLGSKSLKLKSQQICCNICRNGQ